MTIFLKLIFVLVLIVAGCQSPVMEEVRPRKHVYDGCSLLKSDEPSVFVPFLLGPKIFVKGELANRPLIQYISQNSFGETLPLTTMSKSSKEELTYIEAVKSTKNANAYINTSQDTWQKIYWSTWGLILIGLIIGEFINRLKYKPLSALKNVQGLKSFLLNSEKVQKLESFAKTKRRLYIFFHVVFFVFIIFMFSIADYFDGTKMIIDNATNDTIDVYIKNNKIATLKPKTFATLRSGPDTVEIQSKLVSEDGREQNIESIELKMNFSDPNKMFYIYNICGGNTYQLNSATYY